MDDLTMPLDPVVRFSQLRSKPNYAGQVEALIALASEIREECARVCDEFLARGAASAIRALNGTAQQGSGEGGPNPGLVKPPFASSSGNHGSDSTSSPDLSGPIPTKPSEQVESLQSAAPTSDTPLTDALMNDKDAFVLHGPALIIQLARTLERELQTAKDAVAKAYSRSGNVFADYFDAEGERHQETKKKLEAAERALAERDEDAERYRWLREHPQAFNLLVGASSLSSWKTPAEIDAYIAAAKSGTP